MFQWVLQTLNYKIELTPCKSGGQNTIMGCYKAAENRLALIPCPRLMAYGTR